MRKSMIEDRSNGETFLKAARTVVVIEGDSWDKRVRRMRGKRAAASCGPHSSTSSDLFLLSPFIDCPIDKLSVRLLLVHSTVHALGSWLYVRGHRLISNTQRLKDL